MAERHSARGKKVAGILTELSAELDRVKHVILGIGVDVNLAAGEFPPELRRLATSLKIESGKPVDRAGLAAAVLRELDLDYARICAGKFTAVADKWEAHCATIGQDVTVQIGGRKIRGRANRWTTTAHCSSAPNTATWNASPAAT